MPFHEFIEPGQPLKIPGYGSVSTRYFYGHHAEIYILFIFSDGDSK